MDRRNASERPTDVLAAMRSIAPVMSLTVAAEPTDQCETSRHRKLVRHYGTY
jgi:hypothetical protein